jgi:hypothetical protein
MISRRDLIQAAAGLSMAAVPRAGAQPSRKRVAGITTVYHHNSHADVILSRLFQSEDLIHTGRAPALELAGLYVDQYPETDLSRGFARRYGFPIFGTIREALTRGGERLAVDGVLLIGEHGNYPHSAKGQELYPRKRFFDETVEVFRQLRRVVPVFTDKHLSHSWEESREMYDTARRMRFPLMAGSSVPLTWRRPPRDIPRGARVDEILVLSYHTLYGYGFHALELLQSLAELRSGGETGVEAVECLTGPAVWEAGRAGRFDLALLDAALLRLSRELPDTAAGRLQWLHDAVPEPDLFLLHYGDGLKASVLTLNPAVAEWSAAWRLRGRETPESTLAWTQEARPFGHFSYLLRGIEQMIHTGRPAWPVERTLLTSGVLDALLTSRARSGARVETPELRLRYRSPRGGWREPAPPVPGRPIDQP